MDLLHSRGRDGCVGWPSLNKLLLHVELNLNRCFHFHWLAVQNVRFVLPLFHGIHRSVDENWMPLDGTKVFDDSVLTYGRLQKNVTLNVGDSCHLRVSRGDIMDFETVGNTRRDA